jgi:hypothetical protein
MNLYGNFDFKNNILRIQSKEYIEDGWYIEVHNTVSWHVYEIPLHGGKPQLINKFSCMNEAMDCVLNLT